MCMAESSCRLCAAALQGGGGGLQEHCRPPSKLQPPSEATPKAGPRCKVGCSRDQAYSAPASGLLLLLLQAAAAATAAPRCCCCGCTALLLLLHSAACEGSQPALQHRQVLGHCSQCQTPQRQESVAATKRQPLLLSFNFWATEYTGCLEGGFGSVWQQSLPYFLLQHIAFLTWDACTFN